MAQDIVNENQKISYTNLDFAAIYTETLDLIKQLTYKWDPSISDESDPGVILVKLSALLADKLNYNIDKNVLETFPLSVTQDGNARQLYDQLGYYMDWYQSGSTAVAINWTGDTTGEILTYRIPKFTPICDLEQTANKRYTIIGVEGATGNIVSDVLISTDGNPVTALVMEGFPVQYQFEGETVITSQMVDPVSRRLYFTSRYVSQNGVFIKNTTQENYADWKRVNNLYEHTYNELRYIFGYDSQTDTCYLEFPDNYAELIGSGIEITYLLVDPTGGDVIAQELTQLMAPLQVRAEGANESATPITLDNNNLKIINYLASSGHADIEGINEAYINYKRTVGTFKTLITLRDFLNYIRSEDLNVCSNAFVCDRTNDVQSVYKIMNKGKDLTNLVIKVEQLVGNENISSNFDYNFVLTKDAEIVEGKTYYLPSDDGDYLVPITPSGSPIYNRYYELKSINRDSNDALEAFTLKFYMLRKSISLNALSAYNETFTILNPYPDFDSLFADTSHLEHTYGDILPLGKHTFKKSTDEEWSNTKSYWLYSYEEQTYTLITDLSEYYGGTPAQYDNVYDIKIEALMPHVIFYKTVYPLTVKVKTYSEVDADTQELIKSNIINALYTQTASSEMNFGEEVSIDYLSTIIRNSDTRIKEALIYPIDYILYATYFDDEQKAYVELQIDKDLGAISPESYQNATDIIASQIKKDIVAKSILAGTTQLLLPDTEFIYHLPQKFLYYEDNVVKITPETTIDISSASSSYVLSNSQSTLRKTYKLTDNETITLFRPRLRQLDEFLNGLHFEYLISNKIEPDESYKLSPGEYLIIYRADLSEYDNNIQSYTAFAYSTGKIIHPTFELPKQTDLSGLSNFARSQIIPQFEVDLELKEFIETTTNNTHMTEIRNSSSILSHTITGTDKIMVEELDIDEIDKSDAIKFRWVLNNPTYSSNGNIKTYTLFDEYDSEEDSKDYDVINNYTLRTGEIVFTYNDTVTEEGFISSGATLRRNCGVETSQYTEVQNSLYFAEINNLSTLVEKSSFAALTDNDDIIRPREQGLYVLSGDPEPEEGLTEDDNPFEMNLYERKDDEGAGTMDYYVFPSLDTKPDFSKTYYRVTFERTSDPTAMSNQHYYVLVMRKESGDFYETTYKGLDGIDRKIYMADDLETGCFEVVNIQDEDNPTIINPVEEGYYKEMKYNNSYYDDTYALYSGGSATTQHRFTAAADILSTSNLTSKGNEYFEHDSEIFTRKVLAKVSSKYKDIDISIPETYTDIDLADGSFSPYAQKLLVPTQYAAYYSRDPGDEDPERYRAEVTYLTNPYMDKLWIRVEVQEEGQEEPSIEYHKCYDYAEEPEYVHFSPKIEEVESSTGMALLSEVESTFDSQIPNVGCYYKPNALGTVYFFKGVGSAIVPYLQAAKPGGSSSIAPLENLFSEYISATSVSPYSPDNPTSWLEYIDSRWKTSVSFQSPFIKQPSPWVDTESYDYDARVTYTNEAQETSTYKCCVTKSTEGQWVEDEWLEIDTCWKTAKFKGVINEDTGEPVKASELTSTFGYYVLVDAEKILEKQRNLGIIYPNFELEERPEEVIVNPSFYVEASYASFLDASDNPVYVIEDEIGSSLDEDWKLMALFPNVKYDIKEYATIQIYYMPKLYIFNDFVRYTDTIYYKPKKLYRQHCGKIDAWTYKAVNKDALLTGEEQIDDFAVLQPDTSLTVIQNEAMTFSVGDRLIFETDDMSEESVVWPKFTNDETILDLDKYRLYYMKNGENEIHEIKQLKVDNYKWRGYSSLIVNASNRSGQKLEANQTVSVYDNEAAIKPTLIVDGSEGDNVSIQFKNAIESQSGSFIKVTSVDATTKEELPNAIYVFEPYSNGEYYKYGTIDYETALMFNSKEIEDTKTYLPQEIEIPFGLPGGEYLLGAWMRDGIDLEVIHKNYFTDGNTRYNLDAPVINDSSDTTYRLDDNYKNILHSYMSPERTKFTGNMYDYIYTNTGDGRYRKLTAPSLIAINKSPMELELYENNGGTFEKSIKEEMGIDLIIEAPAEVGMNPSELGWYERSGVSYKLTHDTEVQTDEYGEITKDYYMEPELYVEVSKIISSLVFSITKEGEPFDESPITYSLDDIFKFEPNSALGDFDMIRKKVQELDVDDEYAYTFVPSSNDLIENPLDPKAFYETNHIYNNFTIPQLDFENLNIRF